MARRTFLILALSSAICLALGFYAGSNYLKWFYFSDDGAVKASVYHDAIEGLVAAVPSEQRTEIRKDLELMHPDFFRDNELECVRFMPKYGWYSFVRVYCRDTTDKSVKISNY